MLNCRSKKGLSELIKISVHQSDSLLLKRAKRENKRKYTINNCNKFYFTNINKLLLKTNTTANLSGLLFLTIN